MSTTSSSEMFTRFDETTVPVYSRVPGLFRCHLGLLNDDVTVERMPWKANFDNNMFAPKSGYDDKAKSR
jgi:hypothetical protein